MKISLISEIIIVLFSQKHLQTVGTFVLICTYFKSNKILILRILKTQKI